MQPDEEIKAAIDRQRDEITELRRCLDLAIIERNSERRRIPRLHSQRDRALALAGKRQAQIDFAILLCKELSEYLGGQSYNLDEVIEGIASIANKLEGK